MTQIKDNSAPAALERDAVRSTQHAIRPLPLQPEELDVLTPEDRPTLLEWLESEYYLSPKVHGLSSRWSSEYGPFWIPIIEWLSDTVTREVWVYAAAQSGKSSLMTGWLGYTVDCDPVPMGLVMPREDDAAERVETNIAPMFEENPRLLRHVGGNARKINIGKMTMFDNMAFYLMFATSAAAMAGKSICRLGIDEAGKFQMRVGREADAVSLGRDRTETFKTRSKIFGATTPVLKDDLADREWSKGDRCEWWVPCVKKCGRWQLMRWSGVHYDKGPGGAMLEPDEYRAGGHARYVCPFCKSEWSEQDRWSAVIEGKYAPGDCTVVDGRIIGDVRRTDYHSARITAFMLHPAIQTMDYLAGKWSEAISAKKGGDTGPLQGVINSRFAEVWEQAESQPEIARLYPHIGSIGSGTAPVGVQLLTVAVDVQLDHVWVAVVGWGYQFEAWLIWAGRLETGNTERIENFDMVRKFLNGRWAIAADDKRIMRLSLAGIDSGYRTDLVYAVCRGWAELPVVPVMGWSEDKIAGRMYRVVKLSDGLVRYDINTDRFKSSIYRQLFVADVPGPGYVHLYNGIPDEYLKHFTTEHQIREKRKRREFLVWVENDSHGHAPNHLWDLLVYNRFLAEVSGVPALADPKAKTVAIAIPGKPVAKRAIRTKY